MGMPAFRLKAKNKTTGEYVDVAAVFQFDNGGGGYQVKLQPGTVVKVTSKYDKATKGQVPCEVYLTADEWYFNLNSTEARPDANGGGATTADAGIIDSIGRSFGAKPAAPSKLPF